MVESAFPAILANLRLCESGFAAELSECHFVHTMGDHSADDPT